MYMGFNTKCVNGTVKIMSLLTVLLFGKNEGSGKRSSYFLQVYFYMESDIGLLSVKL